VFMVVINSTDPDVRLPTPMSTVTIEDDDGGTLQPPLTVKIDINGKTFFLFLRRDSDVWSTIIHLL